MTTDTELVTLNNVVEEMEKCDSDAQGRIMWWLNQRYKPLQTRTPRGPRTAQPVAEDE